MEKLPVYQVVDFIPDSLYINFCEEPSDKLSIFIDKDAFNNIKIMIEHMKKPTKIYLYQIIINGVIRYYGRTNNLKTREYQHNYHYKKGKDKELYNNLRLENANYIYLECISEFKNITESKRYECYLILKDYFTNKELWQKVPNISDR